LGGLPTLVHYEHYAARAGAASTWDTGSGWRFSQAPGGCSTRTCGAQFDPGTEETGYLYSYLPETWASATAVDFIAIGRTGSSGGLGNDSKWQVRLECASVGDNIETLTIDNTAQTALVDHPTAAVNWKFTISNLDTTGCTAGDAILLEFKRLATDGADTWTTDAEFSMGIFVWRETL
jgi:hypothetical protein